MKKLIGLLSAIALGLGVFLAANTVSTEDNSELSLSTMTSLTIAEAECVDGGVGQRPIYGYRSYICGYTGGEEGDSGSTPQYCTRRVIIGYTAVYYSNNGSCEDGVNCYSGEGDPNYQHTYDCYRN